MHLQFVFNGVFKQTTDNNTDDYHTFVMTSAIPKSCLAENRISLGIGLGNLETVPFGLLFFNRI